MGALFAGFGKGAAIGLAWGLVARLFMRLISTEPSFSWLGTVMILAFASLLWGLIGVVAAARANGRSRWWRVAPLPGLILFAGPGMILLPGAIVVSAALAMRRVALRVAFLAIGLGGTYWAFNAFDDDRFLPARTQTLGYLLAVVTVAWLGAGFHLWWRRWGARREARHGGRRANRGSEPSGIRHQLSERDGSSPRAPARGLPVGP